MTILKYILTITIPAGLSGGIAGGLVKYRKCIKMGNLGKAKLVKRSIITLVILLLIVMLILFINKRD